MNPLACIDTTPETGFGYGIVPSSLCFYKSYQFDGDVKFQVLA